MIRSMPTRQAFVSAIWEYERRKAKTIQKFKSDPSKRLKGEASEKYTAAVANLNRKLKTWRRSLARIDQHMADMKKVDHLVYRFTSVMVRGIKTYPTQEQRLARNIFCKYMLENYRVPQPFLCRHLGFSSPSKSSNCARIRTRYTKSFQTNPENAAIYHRFLEFVKDPY
jgi:hypothetical protein